MRLLRCRLSLERRVNVRLNKMRRILHVDTQRTRKKLIIQLEELFEIASDYARGKVKRVIDEDGKERPLNNCRTSVLGSNRRLHSPDHQ